MPQAKSAKKPANSAPGVKMLITAASLAATVGGWALLSAKGSTATLSPTPPAVAKTSSPTFSINFEPLPTLVPTPTQASRLVTASNRIAPSTNQATQLQQPAAPAMPALRVVTMSDSGGGGGRSQPTAAATTHSSR